MIIYIFELFYIVLNISAGFMFLRFNYKVAGILNLVLAAILIILTVIMVVQDIKAYFYNKKIEKKYKGENNGWWGIN